MDPVVKHLVELVQVFLNDLQDTEYQQVFVDIHID
jgi:hypothetical protein